MGWDAMALLKKQFQFFSTCCGKYQSVANSWTSVRFCSVPLSYKALIFDYFNSLLIARSVVQANAFKVVMHKAVIRCQGPETIRKLVSAKNNYNSTANLSIA